MSTQSKSSLPSVIEDLLSRPVIGQKYALREVKAFLKTQLPKLSPSKNVDAWQREAAAIRRSMLEIFHRGHDPEIIDQEPAVEWGETISPSPAYNVRKLRYEGYPGMWIPALLYEPANLNGKVPAVLNPNGHHMGGKAMPYKQARCINQAKRGMLALNTEFIGMGELRADVDHDQIAHLDLTGLAGIGVFYLIMKRALDLLLAHEHADPDRIAMTGLSGGGWQTALLSALDERIKVIVPVAGHSPVWQRATCEEDIGDMEQIPADICTVADFDKLTAMFAPRPSLLIYNRFDDCCFQSKRTRRSVYQPVKPYFELLGASDRLGFHDNTDPGTHNYEKDNRQQLYRFLNKHMKLDGPETELPWEDEVLSEPEIRVGISTDNATLLSLARDRMISNRVQRRAHRELSDDDMRQHLRECLRMPDCKRSSQLHVVSSRETSSGRISRHKLTIGSHWTLPLRMISPQSASRSALVICNGTGRDIAKELVKQMETGSRIIKAAVLGVGELNVDWKYMMILNGVGQRPLGIQVGQVLSLLSQIRTAFPGEPVDLLADGDSATFAALLATFLQPDLVQSLITNKLLDTLERLIEWPKEYKQAAPLFCMGLLEWIDIPELIDRLPQVPIRDLQRGLLQKCGATV